MENKYWLFIKLCTFWKIKNLPSFEDKKALLLYKIFCVKLVIFVSIALHNCVIAAADDSLATSTSRIRCWFCVNHFHTYDFLDHPMWYHLISGCEATLNSRYKNGCWLLKTEIKGSINDHVLVMLLNILLPFCWRCLLLFGNNAIMWY